MKKKEVILNIALFIISININANNVNPNKQEIDELKREINVIQKNVDNHISLMNLFFSGTSILLAVGLGSSVYFSFKNEKRAKEAFESYNLESIAQKQRSDELYSMFIDDKKKNDQSAAIASTDKTIGLVNKTLKIAIEASKSASKKVQKTYRDTFESIEDECIKLLDKSEAFEEDKNLTLKREILIQIHKLGERSIRAEDGSKFIDQDLLKKDKKIVLLPHSVFIKGTEEFLKEQFDDALKTWKSIILLEDNSEDIKKLKSLTYYWIGYLNNNLKNFKLGIKNFGFALDHADGNRKYELERLIIETEFFRGKDTFVIENKLKELINKIDADLEIDDKFGKKAKILTTLGNVYYSNSKNIEDENVKRKNLFLSKAKFLEVLNIDNENIFENISLMNKEIKNKNKWTIFGLAETMFYIKEDKEIAIKIFESEVMKLAGSEFENREEKRTKILAKTCQLICQYRIDKDSEELNTIKNTIDNLFNDFNKSQTLFSQLQRKNVTYDMFKNDIDTIMNKQLI